MNQAPKGGMTSAVNGWWYEGGQFLPLHGLFAGKAGARRKARADKAAALGRLFGRPDAARLYEVERIGGFPYAALVLADTRTEALETVKAAGVTGTFRVISEV